MEFAKEPVDSLQSKEAGRRGLSSGSSIGAVIESASAAQNLETTA